MSIDWWMDIEDVVHRHNTIILCCKKKKKEKRKEWNNAIWSKIVGTRDYYTKWSKSERERQIAYDITYVKSKIWCKWTYMYETEIESWP